MLKNIGIFLKATITGGVLFLLPIAGILFLIEKTIKTSIKLAKPVEAILGINGFAGIALADILGVSVILLLCLLAGLLTRSRRCRDFVNGAETRYLWKIPAYSFIKGMVDGLDGNNDSDVMLPVLVRLDDAWQPAFEIERMADGRVVVYSPGAPNPWSGAILIVNADRIEPWQVPMVQAVKHIRSLGRGMGESLTRT